MTESLAAQHRKTFFANFLDFFALIISVIKFFFRLLNRLVG
mgnify:CR=1 FL=1